MGTDASEMSRAFLEAKSAFSEEFKVLNARAVIPAGQEIESLLEDVSALTDIADDLILSYAMGETDKRVNHLFAASYLLNIAKAMNQAALHPAGVYDPDEDEPSGKRAAA